MRLDVARVRTDGAEHEYIFDRFLRKTKSSTNNSEYNPYISTRNMIRISRYLVQKRYAIRSKPCICHQNPKHVSHVTWAALAVAFASMKLTLFLLFSRDATATVN